MLIAEGKGMRMGAHGAALKASLAVSQDKIEAVDLSINRSKHC